MDAVIGHKTWRTLEPYHSAIYFVPESPEEMAAEGIDDLWRGYFASRSAPMGPVAASVVVATFFNFEPTFVHASVDGVWDGVTPERVLAARLRAADRMIRRFLGDAVGSDDMAEAAGHARIAAETAIQHVEGRPLFAGHASLPWPDDAHLVLWHAQTLLREFRGDGHVALLAAEGLSGCEALITHAASGVIGADGLKATRRWSDEQWAAAQESLRARGWLDGAGEFTADGRSARERIERRTDELAVAPYAALGEERCDRLRQLVRPWSKVMVAAFG